MGFLAMSKSDTARAEIKISVVLLICGKREKFFAVHHLELSQPKAVLLFHSLVVPYPEHQ